MEIDNYDVDARDQRDSHEGTMPLRDHFHPPLIDQTSWDVVHGQWPAMIVMQLNARLPPRFVAGPLVHLGSEIEVDVASFDSMPIECSDTNPDGWQLAEPSIAVETELLRVDDYEVQVFDTKHNRRLVAVIEIVSPSNKDRAESRQVFASKCEALLRRGVSVAIVDLVTSKQFNLYAEMLELVGQRDPSLGTIPPAIYAVACRWVPRGHKRVLEGWSFPLKLGRPLPTLPIWLADQLAVPLDLEASYEDTCRALRIR